MTTAILSTSVPISLGHVASAHSHNHPAGTQKLNLTCFSHSAANIDHGNIEFFYYTGFAFSVAGIPLSLFIMRQFQPKNYTADATINLSSGDLLAEDGEQKRRRSSMLSSRMSTRE